MIVLGIETSCDETSAAVVRDGREVLASIVHTQQQHKPFGGVVPEIASRCHIELLPGIVEEAVAAAGLPWRAIDATAVTTTSSCDYAPPRFSGPASSVEDRKLG